jgi:hypothetical protein
MKVATTTLATLLALASSSAVAQSASTNHEGNRYPTSRPMKGPSTSPSMSSTYDTSSCRSIPGMGTDNIYGVDNDVNVYRDRPPCR